MTLDQPGERIVQFVTHIGQVFRLTESSLGKAAESLPRVVKAVVLVAAILLLTVELAPR
jgi:hypothetical protein